MPTPISIRLDDEVRKELQAEARTRNIGLATLLRQIAADAAREVRRKRIRDETKAVAEYIKTHPEAQEFYEFWGTPRIEGL
jgi:predicted transcriptional regulator